VGWKLGRRTLRRPHGTLMMPRHTPCLIGTSGNLGLKKQVVGGDQQDDDARSLVAKCCRTDAATHSTFCEHHDSARRLDRFAVLLFFVLGGLLAWTILSP